MRKLAFMLAAAGALALTAPAFAANNNAVDAAQSRSASAPHQSSTAQADEFSAQRRYRGHRHWRGGSHWRGYRHWHGPRRHWRGGWNRCRNVWRPYAGWVRVCRW